jgi:hypothetical protein
VQRIASWLLDHGAQNLEALLAMKVIIRIRQGAFSLAVRLPIKPRAK